MQFCEPRHALWKIKTLRVTDPRSASEHEPFAEFLKAVAGKPGHLGQDDRKRKNRETFQNTGLVQPLIAAAPSSAKLSWSVRRFHTPLMVNKTLTAQNDSNDPRVTGSKVAANAHHSIIPNWQRFRASTKIIPPAKQTAGVRVSVSIQNKDVADQSLLNPLVAK